MTPEELETLLEKQGALLGAPWIPIAPPEAPAACPNTVGRPVDARALVRWLGPPAPAAPDMFPGYWWRRQRADLVVGTDGRCWLDGMAMYPRRLWCKEAAAHLRTSLDGAAAALRFLNLPVDRGPLVLTATNLSAELYKLATHPGAVELRGLSGAKEPLLNSLRWGLICRGLGAGVLVDGVTMSVDALVSRIIEWMGPRAIRFRAPSQLSTAEIRAIRRAMEDETAVFYLDEEEMPLDEGALFDLYEDLLFGR